MQSWGIGSGSVPENSCARARPEIGFQVHQQESQAEFLRSSFCHLCDGGRVDNDGSGESK